MTGRGRRDANRLRRAAAMLALCSCLAPVSSHAEDAAAPAAEVVVTRAARECFTSLIHASGYLVPRRTAVVMFAAPGYRVAEVRVKAGDTVKRGDVVARVASAGPDKSGASGTIDLKASASGLVLQAVAFVGMPISEKAKPLFTIAADGEIEASVAVPGIHVDELKPGQPAHLKTREGRVLDGEVRRTPAVIDAASQMGTTLLSLGASKGLEPSRFVQATIEARRSCGIGVPMAALKRTSTGTTIQVVKDDRIVDRPVQLGLANETDSEITSGLAEGDLVVAGTGSSRDGDRVKPVLSDQQDLR